MKRHKPFGSFHLGMQDHMADNFTTSNDEDFIGLQHNPIEIEGPKKTNNFDRLRDFLEALESEEYED